MASIAEYIWLDGEQPTRTLRSKSRVLQLSDATIPKVTEFPEWGFDGSSTSQAAGDNSDLVLKPVRVIKDPIRKGDNYLVLCEVYDVDGTPHESNTRALLRKVLEAGGYEQDPWLGFEQEYTLFNGRNPLGWPENGYPRPQGPFYCGVGSDRVHGRELVEEHMSACIDAGLIIYGVNAEVMPGQWEYQVGYRGFKGEEVDALLVSDHQWLCRWLLCRLAEDKGVTVSFENKPIQGDWNGAGCHTNFSTAKMRDPKTGKAAIDDAVAALGEKHSQHIALYGHDLDKRLTGLHETCSINEFKSGACNRGASIRIPAQVSVQGYGYLEDRRPGANSDPYLVSARLITTICGIDESAFDVPSSLKENFVRQQADALTS